MSFSRMIKNNPYIILRVLFGLNMVSLEKKYVNAKSSYKNIFIDSRFLK